MARGKKIGSKLNDKLIVALEGDCIRTAERIVEAVISEVNYFKVGMQLFTSEGPSIIRMVQDHGGRVFLDLKYHDIPSVVGKAIRCATKLGVDMINIHASGGCKMMEEAFQAVLASEEGKRPLLIAVTVLTSMESLGDIGVQFEVRDQVVRLAKLAQEVGLDGVMSSPMDIQPIRQACGGNLKIVVSGVRLPGSSPNDQKRFGVPRQAMDAGADYLVVGRPIVESRDPLSAVKAILKDMGQGRSKA